MKERDKLFWLLLGITIMFIGIFTYQSIYITADFTKIDKVWETEHFYLYMREK